MMTTENCSSQNYKAQQQQNTHEYTSIDWCFSICLFMNIFYMHVNEEI